MAKEKRFKKVYSEGKLSVYEIIEDTETGVNYIQYSSGYASGLTPLLGSDGKVVITKKQNDSDF